jgi:hypothetical protein
VSVDRADAPERPFYARRSGRGKPYGEISRQKFLQDDIEILYCDSPELIRLRRIAECAELLRLDLNLRAEIEAGLNGDDPVVNVSNGVWERFCDALSANPTKPEGA